jgi:mRNA interferase MazF
MNINQGEIWMVHFEPSVGSEIQKLRPAIVVNDDRVGRFGIKIVLPITEWKEYYINYPWIIKITPNSTNGLSKDSSIECFQIKSFDTDRFETKIGQIDKSLLIQVHSTIIKTLNPLYKLN